MTSYLYDSLGQLTNISYSDPAGSGAGSTPAVSFTYDRLGRQTAITDGTGTRNFTYNSALQLTSEICNQQSEITRRYDVLGRDAGFDDGPGYSIRYGYDAIGRFASVQSAVSGQTTNVFTYSYLPGSDLVQGYSTDAGFSFMRAYEPNRNLISGITNSFCGVAMHRFDYVNDAAGRRVQRADVDISTVISNLFAYNARSELEDAAMGTNSYSYRYDPIGNRRVATNTCSATGGNAEAISYAANALNQYTSILDGTAIAPRYDSDGNLTNYGVFAYAWDAENRLVSVSSNGALVATYQYDYMSRRVAKTVNSQTTHFTYQGWAMFEEVRSSSTNHYVYGLDLSGSQQGAGTIGGILSGYFSGAKAFYCYDANGNVTDLVGTNGVFLAQYQFDPYGNTISKTGALADANPFRFSTKYLDAETGFYYYGHRYYSSEMGRWLSRDPLKKVRSHRNMFLFVSNRATSRIDPVGEDENNVPTPSYPTDMLCGCRDGAPTNARGGKPQVLLQTYIEGGDGFGIIGPTGEGVSPNDGASGWGGGGDEGTVFNRPIHVYHDVWTDMPDDTTSGGPCYVRNTCSQNCKGGGFGLSWIRSWDAGWIVGTVESESETDDETFRVHHHKARCVIDADTMKRALKRCEEGSPCCLSKSF